MRNRRLGFLLAGIVTVLAAAVLPTSLAAASPVSAGRAAASSPASAVIAHHTTSCGRAMTVYTPRTPSAALPGAALGLPSGPHSVLGIASQWHVRWLSTVTCKARPAPRIPKPKPVPGRATTNDFLNWAGYENSISSPNYVQASWQIPTVCCNYNGPDKSSIWPGIGDGNTKGTDLIQTGTEQDVSTSNTASYYFWYETWPKPQQLVTNLAAHPGDYVAVSASYGTLAPGYATFVVCDVTQNTCFDTSELANPPDNYAEWIAERTSYCNAGDYWFPALTSFANMQFTNGYYDLSGTGNPEYTISQGSPAQDIMTDVKNNTLATPGSLDSSGTSFPVVWNDYGTPSEVQPLQAC